MFDFLNVFVTYRKSSARRVYTCLPTSLFLVLVVKQTMLFTVLALSDNTDGKCSFGCSVICISAFQVLAQRNDSIIEIAAFLFERKSLITISKQKNFSSQEEESKSIKKNKKRTSGTLDLI